MTPSPRPNRAAAQTASIHLSPKSCLAVFVALACVFTLGIDVPVTLAAPAPNPPAKGHPASKDKKAKQDPALKGLPITELTADEAVMHAMNRLAYGPRPRRPRTRQANGFSEMDRPATESQFH